MPQPQIPTESISGPEYVACITGLNGKDRSEAHAAQEHVHDLNDLILVHGVPDHKSNRVILESLLRDA